MRRWIDLQAGDTFERDGTTVTVLRTREPYRDMFGRDLLAHWCRREDTGREGYAPFGPEGVLHG